MPIPATNDVSENISKALIKISIPAINEMMNPMVAFFTAAGCIGTVAGCVCKSFPPLLLMSFNQN